MIGIAINPGSFRDPARSVYETDGRIYRKSVHDPLSAFWLGASGENHAPFVYSSRLSKNGNFLRLPLESFDPPDY